MDWSDEGMVIATRRHGELAAIVTLLTRAHGRHAGLARGGSGRRGRGLYQPGNVVAATWRARLAEHLGTWSCEPLHANGVALLDRAGALAALAAACALVDAVLPEREPHGALYDATLALVSALAGPAWAERYVRWEIDLLTELGFGLDLGSCAATGANDGLAYVSPRTGRAVSAAAGEPYRDRLLALPPFLVGPEGGPPGPGDIAAGLALTGFFLARCVFTPEQRPLPAPRTRLVDAIARNPTICGVPSDP